MSGYVPCLRYDDLANQTMCKAKNLLRLAQATHYPISASWMDVSLENTLLLRVRHTVSDNDKSNKLHNTRTFIIHNGLPIQAELDTPCFLKMWVAKHS